MGLHCTGLHCLPQTSASSSVPLHLLSLVTSFHKQSTSFVVWARFLEASESVWSAFPQGIDEFHSELVGLNLTFNGFWQIETWDLQW